MSRYVEPINVTPERYESCMTREELVEEVARVNPVKGYRELDAEALLAILKEALPEWAPE
jgi:hypothetical protein